MPKTGTVADFEKSVADTPRLALLYLGTRNLDQIDQFSEILDRSEAVASYVGLVGTSLDREHLREFLSTAGHVYQALAVRLQKIERAEVEDRSRYRGGV